MESFYQRKIDELGRVVLPLELRKIVNLNERDTVRITTEEGLIILEKVAEAT